MLITLPFSLFFVFILAVYDSLLMIILPSTEFNAIIPFALQTSPYQILQIL